MDRYLTEQLDMVSENVIDNIQQYIKDLYNDPNSTPGRAMKKAYQLGLKPQEGYVQNFPQLATQAATNEYQAGLDRGATEGAGMGLVGGMGLGAGLAGRGTVSSVARGASYPFSQQFDKDFQASQRAEVQRLQDAGDTQGSQRVAARRAPGVRSRALRGGRGAIANLIGNLITKAVGAGIGGAAGAFAGYQGGRQTGARILGAGLAAAPLGAVAQPLAALGAVGGAVSANKMAREIERAKKTLQGGPDNRTIRA